MANNFLPKVRANKEQRRVLTNYLTNGGSKPKAFMAVFSDKCANWPIRKINKAANAYFHTVTMKALMIEGEIETRVNMEKKAERGLDTAITKYGITKERIMEELAKIAFASQTDVMSWGPDGVVVKNSGELGDAGAAVGEVVQTGGGESPVIMKVKLLDKRQALIDLGKEIGMFNPTVNVKGQVQAVVGAKFIIERD